MSEDGEICLLEPSQERTGTKTEYQFSAPSVLRTISSKWLPSLDWPSDLFADVTVEEDDDDGFPSPLARNRGLALGSGPTAIAA